MIFPDIEAFEENSAIAEQDAWKSREDAEDLAARQQGYSSSLAYWQWLSHYVAHRKAPDLTAPVVTPGTVVVLRALDDIPQHLFRVTEVFDGDLLGGYSLTGPLADEYGEPGVELVLRVLRTDGT
jgi:hypothetical protein